VSTAAAAFVKKQKQQLPWRRLYRGGKPPEDGCMKPKHVVQEEKINIVAY
jgi:hypothetical protein